MKYYKKSFSGLPTIFVKKLVKKPVEPVACILIQSNKQCHAFGREQGKPAMALERASHSIGHNEHSVTGKDGMDGDGGNLDGGAGGR